MGIFISRQEKQTTCNHHRLLIQDVVGPIQYAKYKNIQFIHVTCKKCGISGYRCGPASVVWQTWIPKHKQEIQRI
jgi:RNase P subunit RPR2